LDALVACSVLVVDGELVEAKLVLDPAAAVLAVSSSGCSAGARAARA